MRTVSSPSRTNTICIRTALRWRDESHHRSSTGHGPAHDTTLYACRPITTCVGDALNSCRPLTLTTQPLASFTTASNGSSYTIEGEGVGNAPLHTVSLITTDSARRSMSTTTAGVNTNTSPTSRPPRHCATRTESDPSIVVNRSTARAAHSSA